MKENNKTLEDCGGSNFAVISVCLVIAIVAVYWPVYNYDFIQYDDQLYVTDNTNIHSGFNFQSVKWAFTSGYASNWHPVTWLSHTLDCRLFGRWAGGHHLVNVLFHILNTLLLFYVFMQMTGAIWPSAFVAAAFALHPLHVESVAWIAERKDVLSTFFWLLTMLAYVRYVRNPKLKWYLAAIILFVLGLMSKPMLVTLPFVLLLLDYWPLERKISHKLLISAGRLTAEKIPFFICSALSSIITFLVQYKSGAVTDIEMHRFKVRIGNIIASYADYIIKMIWPGRLAVLYPYPIRGLPTAKVIISALILLLISVYFIREARRRKFLLVGWLWYLGTLIPVIGLVQVGAQAMADRYAYMTLTGLFIIIAFAAPKQQYKLLIFPAAAILMFWSFSAFQQVKYWKDSLTLFERTLQITKANFIILSNYATCLNYAGRFDEAIEEANESLKISPTFADAHYNLGLALTKLGKDPAAIEQFELVIKYKPDFTAAYNNLAAIMYKQGRNEEAIGYFEQLLKLEPDFSEGRLNFGSALLQAGRTEQAIEQFRLVVKRRPDYPQAYYNLAIALREQGKPEEAVSCYEQALKIKPDYIEARLKLAVIFNEMKKFDRAIESFNKVLEREPNNVIANGNLGMALAALGKTDEAIEKISFVLNARPEDVEMHRNLGILLEQGGDVAGAIKSYRAALQIDPNNTSVRDNLNAALKKQTTH